MNWPVPIIIQDFVHPKNHVLKVHNQDAFLGYLSINLYPTSWKIIRFLHLATVSHFLASFQRKLQTHRLSGGHRTLHLQPNRVHLAWKTRSHHQKSQETAFTPKVRSAIIQESASQVALRISCTFHFYMAEKKRFPDFLKINLQQVTRMHSISLTYVYIHYTYTIILYIYIYIYVCVLINVQNLKGSTIRQYTPLTKMDLPPPNRPQLSGWIVATFGAVPLNFTLFSPFSSSLKQQSFQDWKDGKKQRT